MNWKIGLVAAWMCVLTGSVNALSTAITYPPEIDKRRNFAPLDESLFGDKVQLQDGVVSFTQTDVSVPTNSGMRLAIGRRTPVGRASPLGTSIDIFADWELDIPMMKGTYDARDGWNAGTLDGRRCSTGTFVPKAEPPLTSNLGTSPLYQSMYWHGVQVMLPQLGTETVLKTNSGQVLPTDGKSYVGTTKSEWRVSCLTSIQNGAGEGFVVRASDGNSYQFDWIVTRPVQPLNAIGVQAPFVLANLQEVYLYATKVTDRHGNTITYSYDPANPSHLTSVSSNDGGSIGLSYASGRVSSVSAAGRTWNYAYGSSGLSSVTLPDSTAWTFSGSQESLSGANMWGPMIGFWSSACNVMGTGGSETSGYGIPPVSSSSPMNIVMTHPSGAVGTFTFNLVHHGTTNTPAACFFSSGMASLWGIPPVYASLSLAEKTVQGPGLPVRDWRYNYSFSWSLSCSNCTTTSSTTILRNDGIARTYKYGNNYALNLGQLVSETVSGAGAQQTTAYTYLASAAGQPFPDNVGDIALGLYDVSAPSYPQAYGNPFESQRRPMVRVDTTVDGVTLSKAITSFDRFARPIAGTESNSSYSRTRGFSYFDDSLHWVLGQLATSSTNSVVVSQTDYDSLAHPWHTYAFGKLQGTLLYGADGTLSTVTDGNGATETYSNWKRGIPQTIRYPATTDSPQGAVQTAVVDDNGWLSSATDSLGDLTCYSYDLGGRLSNIVYPLMTNGATCDTAQAYLNQTTISSGVSTTAEYGIPAGHWKQTTQTGQGVQNLYFDAYWRPIVTERYDASNPTATRTIQVTRFDISEKPSFTSYPMNALSDWSTTNVGTRWTYDGLARVTRAESDTELGVEATTTTYGAMSIAAKNPRGYTTTTAYQMFDVLDYDRPMSVTLPESASMTFARDAVGSTVSLTRASTSGTAVSATRSYVYDANEQLCKIIEPENGATLMDWDAAGNRAWITGGTTLTGNTCDRASVAAAQKISFAYDALHRLTGTTYGDGSPGTLRTYKPDGLLATVSSDGSAWAYEYNVLRKITSETMSFGGASYALNWAYDANGNLRQVTYPAPASKVVSFAPNALGQATQAQGYATDVTYYPNGGARGFTLGNGISHAVTQNTRQLTASIVDAGVLNDGYSYDENGNVSKIQDNQTGATTRTLGYDGLDRLTTANGTWGNGSYTYDALDNILTAAIGSRSMKYVYDATHNRLQGISVPPGGISYLYDANGNVTKGSGTYVYDLGNRLRNVSGVATHQYDGLGRRTYTSNADGSTVLQMYDLAGSLMYTLNGTHATNYIYLGQTALAEDDSANGITYLHSDGIGTPIARTNAAAVQTSTSRFEPYGHVYSGYNPTSPDAIGFTGHVNDASSLLVYMQQRYYDPFAGRFMSVDPIITDANTGKGFGLYTYVQNNPYSRIDPDGRRDIYIGGASDKDNTRIVQDYAAGQKALNPDRDIQYFSYSQKSEIAAAISAPLKEGEPLNVIGHSLGGRAAINQANGTKTQITNLASIDPVGSAGTGKKPANVGTWTDVTAVPKTRNWSDTVASWGRALFGTTKTGGADTSTNVTTNHGNFSTMMSAGPQAKVDDSYKMRERPNE